VRLVRQAKADTALLLSQTLAALATVRFATNERFVSEAFRAKHFFLFSVAGMRDRHSGSLATIASITPRAPIRTGRAP
jgi:hypothetical protein